MKIKKLIISLFLSIITLFSMTVSLFAYDVEREGLSNSSLPAEVTNLYHSMRVILGHQLYEDALLNGNTSDYSGLSSSFYIGTCGVVGDNNHFQGYFYYLTDDSVITITSITSKPYSDTASDYLTVNFKVSNYYYVGVKATYSRLQYNNPVFCTESNETFTLYSDYPSGIAYTATNFPLDDLYQYSSSYYINEFNTFRYHMFAPRAESTSIGAYALNSSFTLSEDGLKNDTISSAMKNDNGMYLCDICGEESERIYYVKHLGYVCADCYSVHTGSAPSDDFLYDDTSPIDTGVEWLDTFLNSFSTVLSAGENGLLTLMSESTGFFELISTFFTAIPTYIWDVIFVGLVILVILRVLGR